MEFVNEREHRQVLAIAAAYADRSKYCAAVVATGDEIGITRKMAETVYRISREQAARTPRTRRGNYGSQDYQLVADLYQ